MDQLLQTFNKFYLLLFALLLLIFSGCQKKQIVIKASIPKEVAIAKGLRINNNKEASTKGVESILAPLISGVSDSYFKNKFTVKRECIEYQIVIYMENKNDYFVIDFLDGKLVIRKKGENDE